MGGGQSVRLAPQLAKEKILAERGERDVLRVGVEVRRNTEETQKAFPLLPTGKLSAACVNGAAPAAILPRMEKVSPAAAGAPTVNFIR